VRKELQAVLVKAAHGGEVVSESFGVSGFQLLNQQPDVVGNEFLFGVGLLAIGGSDVVGVGCAAHGVVSFAFAPSCTRCIAAIATAQVRERLQNIAWIVSFRSASPGRLNATEQSSDAPSV
jgi:hypothetical protein